MESWLINLISLAYASVGIINILAYWPTIRDLHHHRRKSANMSSYMIWTATSFVTLLYSLFILPDFLFRAVSLLSFIACAVVLILCLRLRYD